MASLPESGNFTSGRKRKRARLVCFSSFIFKRVAHVDKAKIGLLFFNSALSALICVPFLLLILPLEQNSFQPGGQPVQQQRQSRQCENRRDYQRRIVHAAPEIDEIA